MNLPASEPDRHRCASEKLRRKDSVWYACWLSFLMLVMAGCSTTSTSNTKRTAKEQLLISNAIDQSLDKVDFSSFRGSRVFLDAQYVDAIDKSYLVAATRHRLLQSGAQPVEAADGADVVLEMRAGAVGTDTSDSFVGIPEITLPGMMTLPELRLVTRSSQQGIAKVGFAAYGPKSRQALGEGGVALSKSDDNNWYVLGVGPWQNGSIRKELTRSVKLGGQSSMHSFPSHVAFNPPPAANANGMPDTVPPGPTAEPNPFKLTGQAEAQPANQ